MASFTSLVMKHIAFCSDWSRFGIKLIYWSAFGLAPSACSLLKSIVIIL